MEIWDIPAQDRAVQVLRGAVARGDIGHAWAFVGPPDVGQQRAARAFAAQANDAVGDDVLTGRFMRGAHPAYREFTPVGISHRKEDVHGLWLEAANSTVKEGRVKVLRIVAADRMNDNAANAFLKALEEPPPGTVWILDLTDPQEVPDTIMSRCRVVSFAPWTRQQLLDLAASLGVTHDAELVVRAAMGSPSQVRNLADPKVLEDYRLHRSWLVRVREDGAGFALHASRALKEEISRRTKAVAAQGDAELEELTELYGDTPPKPVIKDLEERYKRLGRAEQTTTVQHALDHLVSWCRDAIVVGGGGQPTGVRNIDAWPQLVDQADTVTPAALLDICDAALHTRESIEVNVAWNLAIESFILGAHARSLQP